MLILASASPRRHELLLAAGIDHVVRPSSVPEVRHPGESPTEFVRRIAEAKARAVVSDPQDIVLGADTDDIQGYTRSGEPSDKAGAYAIQGLASKFVRSLEGSYHNVVGLPVSLVYLHLRAL
jgi:predicted house-cleaning NTP pyrophosphatase (Maf/HAM1 superfamily)